MARFSCRRLGLTSILSSSLWAIQDGASQARFSCKEPRAYDGADAGNMSTLVPNTDAGASAVLRVQAVQPATETRLSGIFSSARDNEQLTTLAGGAIERDRA